MTDAPPSPAPASQEPARPVFSTPQMVKAQEEVAAARAELAATVDALVFQLSPRNQATKAAAGARQMLADAADPEADPAARRRALLVLGATAAVTLLVTVGVVRKILH